MTEINNMSDINEVPWCKHGINKTGHCAECKVATLTATIESMQSRADKWATKERYLTGAVAKYADENASFITTIESQTKQFEKLKLHAEHLQALVDGQDQSHTGYVNETETLIEQKDALIESQKEEIEKATAKSKHQIELTLEFNQMYTDISLKLTDKNAEIESLKAITELAVKGLKEIKWDADKAEFISLNGANNFKEFISDKIQSKLSEIERLSQ